MTDNDIIKANEICNGIQDKHCEECPYQNIRDNDCVVVLAKDTIDLINRQRAEIEMLEGNLKFVRGTVERMKKHDEERDIRLHARLTETARAEAIKEFAERLKDKVDAPVLIEGKYIDRVIDIIDKLVKEMTEQRKEDEKNENI